MILDKTSYVPTLSIRSSEMNGLEYLPGASKDKMVPCILLAPWTNSKKLSKSIERVERAFRKRNYFLDIDRNYQFSNPVSSAQTELLELLDPHNSYEKWCDFVGLSEFIIPCIQTSGQNQIEILKQIGRYQAHGKSYCLRITLDFIPDNLDVVISALADMGTADYAIILEGGWTHDPLLLQAEFISIIKYASKSIDANIPIIISCTSAPKEFSNFDNGANIVPYNNRTLVSEIIRHTNRSNIKYGDWGSTRPREPAGFAGRPLDRIDYPIKDKWVITRNKSEAWNFQDAASFLTNNLEIWEGNLGIWGEEMIMNTRISPALGIDTPQKNVASRVNIHLHRQAMYEVDNLGTLDLDEDWED